MDQSPPLLRRAQTLDDFYKTLSPEPLIDYDQFDAFYKDDLNAVRGSDKVAHIKLGLKRAFGGAFYKAFLVGHPGVGKSTEMTRLERQISEQYRTIRFSVGCELNPSSFTPFDVLLVMMMLVVQRTSDPLDKGGAGKAPDDRHLKDIIQWFSVEKISQTQGTATSIGAEAGAGPSASSMLGKVLGLFATVKGEVKYTANRKHEVVEYQLRRISTLIDLLNQLLGECNAILREQAQREWLFICEDFDKPDIPTNLTERLFLEHANLFSNLKGHLIFSVPIGLVYSERSPQLAFSTDRIHMVPDMPVFEPDHSPHQEGRAALREILGARVDPSLFGDDTSDRLIVASGGNLRDLFAMVNNAADFALLRGSDRIEPADANRAITEMRTQYGRSLGESPYDPAKLTYDQKAKRLCSVYRGDSEAEVPDPALYSLLNARAVQEFNGERWFGVHPLVVDVLKKQERLPEDAAGGTR